MKILEIVTEGFKEVSQKYLQAGADQNQINQTIEKYRQLVNKNQVKGDERNIDWWGKNKSFDEFQKFVDSKAAQPTVTSVKRNKNVGKSVTIHEDENWLVVIPLDKDASCFHGRGSSWCTTKANQGHFENYFYNREIILIYCLNKKDGGMWAIAGHKDLRDMEMFDKQDNSISSHEFKNATGFEPKDLLNKALQHDDKLGSSRTTHKEKVKSLDELLKNFDFKGRNQEIESMLIATKDPRLCQLYVQELDGNQVPDETLSKIPDAIWITAVGYSANNLFILKNPKPAYIESAIEGRPDIVLDILQQTKFELSPRAVHIAFVRADRETLGEITRQFNAKNIKIPQSAIDERCETNPYYVFPMALYGFKTKINNYKEAFEEYPDSVGSYAKEFANLNDPEIMKLVIDYSPEAIKYVKTLDSDIIKSALEGTRYTRDIYAHTIFKGHFPTIEEQKLDKENTDIKGLVDSNINRFINALKNDKVIIKQDIIDKIRKTKMALKDIEEFLRDPNSSVGDDTKKVLREYVDKYYKEIEAAKADLKDAVETRKDMRRRIEALRNGERTIGYIKNQGQ